MLWAFDAGLLLPLLHLCRPLLQGQQVGCLNSASRREELRDMQMPGAVIVTCSDSRVPPELLLDQGLGDLFVVRIAGNVVDRHVLGSISYALQQLGTRLVVVLVSLGANCFSLPPCQALAVAVAIPSGQEVSRAGETG